MTDVLADLFDEMYLSGEVVARFELSSPWGITMPARGGIFHAIDQGECWIRESPDGDPFKAKAGDLVIFTGGASHDVVDRPGTRPQPLAEALSSLVPNSFRCSLGGRGPVETTFVCGVFHFREGGHHAFESLLPPVMHVRGDGEEAEWVRLTTRRLSEEAASAAPGSLALVNRLTDMIFIEGVRAWLETKHDEEAGWLGALNDPTVAGALACIHGSPGEHWTIATLASEVGLSRSALAQRFTRLVGKPPMEYLTLWRMQLAKRLLHQSDAGLAEITDRLGYSSEDAFKRAFKREVGTSPGAYRRGRESGPA